MPALLLAYENSIVHPDDLSRVDAAFFSVFGGRAAGDESTPVDDTKAVVESDVRPDVSSSPSSERDDVSKRYKEGIPIHLHKPTYHPRGGYLAFLGRISPEKRPDRAIALARAAGIPLKIAAKVDKVDEAYFQATIAPLLDQPGVEFIGEIDERGKAEFLGNARALLFPIDWPEPFGLSMIEAMACGTPVIAFNRGSVPEIIEDGVNGFIVEDEISAVGAVHRLEELSRAKIRARFEQRFTSQRMARDYLEVYQGLAKVTAPRPRLVSG